MAAPVLQFKRGSSTTITSGIVSFRAGEPGFTTDRSDFYIGLDGTSGGNKFFGSARYWNRETTTTGSSVRVVEGSNNGNNFIALKSPDSLASDVTYTLPVGVSTAGYILQNDGTGTLNWVPAAASGAITGITVQDEGGTVGTAGSVTSINFVGNGIVATASGSSATITLSTATTSTIGVASFNSTDFYVNAGAVGINTESIQDMVGSAITAGVSAGINTNVTVTYDDANNRIGVGVNTATTSVLGVASFNSTNFSVTNGAVSIANNAIGLGTNTTGQYAKSITSGNGLSGTAGAADDGTDYTIDVNTGAGITITSDAVAFKNAASLSNNTLMKYDTGNSQLTNSIITDNGSTATVTGGLTVTGTLTGTASTATLANTVVTTTAPNGTYYPGFFASGTGVAATSVYVDSGISYVSNTDTLTATNLTVTGTLTASLTGTATTATRATLVDTTTAPNGTFYPGFFANSTGTASTSVYVDAGISYVSNTDTLTVQNLTVPGTLTGTATTATKLNTNNGSAVSGYIPFVTNGTATNGETFYVDTAIQYNGSTDTLTVNNAQHSAVKALDGVAAITITSGTGDVGISSNLTVTGNLYVNGTTTQVNTNTLTVEDRTIELGLVGAATTTTSTWDLAVLFNYGDAGTAKKSAVVWETGTKRFQFGSALTTLGADTNGSDVSTPAIDIGTANFAPIEIGALWMNDTAGQNAVATYLSSGSAATEIGAGAPAGRYLLNITVDGGTF